MRTTAVSRRTFLKYSAGAPALPLWLRAPVGRRLLAGGEAAPAAAEQLTLSFWSEGAAEWAEQMNAQYMEANPNINIEFVTFQWGEMTPKLMTASAGGTAPNITRQDRFRMAGWAGRGGAEPLDSFVDQYGINAEDYWPATWAEGVWQGTVYSIPFYTDGRFVFWNKDIFAEVWTDAPPPTQDWEAMVDLAARLTKTADDGASTSWASCPARCSATATGATMCMRGPMTASS